MAVNIDHLSVGWMSLGGKTAHLLPCCMCMPSNVTEFIGSGPAARRRSRPAAPPSNVVLHSDRRMQSILSGRPPSAVPTRRHPRIIQVWSLPPKDFTASIEPVRSNPLRCTASARSFRRPFATRINAATNKPKLSIDRPLTPITSSGKAPAQPVVDRQLACPTTRRSHCSN